MEENGKLFLSPECQLIDVEGMKKIENYHLAIEVLDLDGRCQWMLRLVGGGLMRNILMYSWKTLYKILINHKGFSGTLMWKNMADTNVTSRSRLTSPVMGKFDVVYLLMDYTASFL